MRMRRFIGFALFLLILPNAAQAADVSGIPHIRDANQVTIGNTRIRLAGSDAPGRDQLCLNANGERWSCGVAAHDALVARASDKNWTCRIQRTDRFGRSVAKCEADGEDIAQWLVKTGWALAYVRFSRVYEPEDQAARAAKVGLWSGAFIAPWEWRVRNKKAGTLGAIKPTPETLPILFASASGAVAPSPACRIKGNVNRSGVCIYHTPESRWYAKIKMRVSKGTRWFCSKEEAEAAGCRETRR
ncbi:thermonuclease family protein [Tardiphaga alba]|uniref:Thermonuclease family protein n=1 Tax=Tardiphaga alba TaxID=340268 RepID=A0ABX8A599_9BRAD|nr:thermonuclease family protein [Tardiphaga alba]QUS37879.1 thermonuclease family protein [Tardiphaga alba]